MRKQKAALFADWTLSVDYAIAKRAPKNPDSNLFIDLTPLWQIKPNELVVNQTSGTVSVNSAGRSGITQITLPASGSVALDLSQTTNVAIANNGVTNTASLSAVAFPQSSFTLGNSALKDSTNLSTIVNLSNCTSVGSETFSGCTSVASLDLSGCTSVGNSAFSGCTGLTGVNLANCTSVGQSAFDGCTGLTGINLPECETLGQNAFNGCTNIQSISLPDCTSVGTNAFAGCKDSLKSLNLASRTSISNDEFKEYTALETVDISSCTSIGKDSFNSCSSLKTVTLGNSQTIIGEQAFQDCSALETINLSKCTEIGSHAFQNCVELSGTVDLSSCQNGKLGEVAFDNCKKITGVVINNNMKKIEGWTFRDCTALQTINLSNCETLGRKAFQRCTNLQDVDLSNCTEIGDNVFDQCHSIINVSLPKCKKIGNDAFYGAIGLVNVTFGTPLQSIGTRGFAWFNNTGTVFTFPKSPTSGITFQGPPNSSFIADTTNGPISANEVDTNGTVIHTYTWNGTSWDQQS